MTNDMNVCSGPEWQNFKVHLWISQWLKQTFCSIPSTAKTILLTYYHWCLVMQNNPIGLISFRNGFSANTWSKNIQLSYLAFSHTWPIITQLVIHPRLSRLFFYLNIWFLSIFLFFTDFFYLLNSFWLIHFISLFRFFTLCFSSSFSLPRTHPRASQLWRANYL